MANGHSLEYHYEGSCPLLARRLCALVFFPLILVFFAGSLRADFGVPTEVIKNGGFEQGLENWSTTVGHALCEEPKQSHSGEKCIVGEVTAENQAQKLIQSIEVKKGNLYEFSCFAKSDNRCKLVLFYTMEGGKRTSITPLTETTRQWKKFETVFNAPETGTMEFELVSPSSYGSPIGKLWLDDISLRETELPPTINITNDEGYNDEVAATRCSDGTFYVTWNSYRTEPGAMAGHGHPLRRTIQSRRRKSRRTRAVGNCW